MHPTDAQHSSGNGQGGKGKGVVFFIDKEQFTSEVDRLPVRTLLVTYAKEDPAQTTLVLRHGNDLQKFANLDEVIELKNGAKFTVFHNGPTTVS